jgi:hypothetical protein
MFDFHLWPFKQATVASMSSISPWRQFCPSILEIDAMFPAPKASACVGSSTRIAIATSSRYCDETPMIVCRARSKQKGDVKEGKSWSSSLNHLRAVEVSSTLRVRRRCEMRHTSSRGPLSLAKPSNLRGCNPLSVLCILWYPKMLRSSNFTLLGRFACLCQPVGDLDCATLPHFMC